MKNPTPKVNNPRKTVTPTQAGCGCLSAIAIVVALAMFGNRNTPQQFSTSSSPSASPRTPLQERVRAALERAEEAKRADAAMPDRVRKAEVGVVTTIVGPGASWPCASSKVALKELMKWHKAMLDEQAPDSVMSGFGDSLMRTRSIMVEPRTQVKILEKEPGVRKVTVMDHKHKYGSGYTAATAQGCWMVAEAVTR